MVAAREAVPEHDDFSVGEKLFQTNSDNETIRAQLWYLVTSYPRLAPQIQQVYKVQFLSWMGWFTFLFYVAVYIGDNCKPVVFHQFNTPSFVYSKFKLVLD
jgi:hypothetical protein